MNVGGGGNVEMVGQVLLQPQPALRVSDRMRRQRRNRVKGIPRSRDKDKADGNHIFADDAKLGGHGEGILGGTHASLNAVFDRNHRVCASFRENVLKRFADVIDADPFACVATFNLTQGFPREGPYRSEIAVAFHLFSHPPSLVSRECPARSPVTD